MSKKNIYALLVGINEYPIPQHKLRGCVNDVTAFGQFLQSRCQNEHTQLHLRILLDGEATRENIKNGFVEHMAQAGENDVALFYFSGHGAQEPAPPEFWYMEPSKLNQSIVCVDSRTPTGGNGDIVNKELSYLLWEVGRKNAHVVAIMDCCHSGAGTRSAGDDPDQVTLTRQIPVSERGRSIKEYFGSHEFAFSQTAAGLEVRVPQANHVLLAAARSKQYAKETVIDGQPRGIFNFSLIETLQSAKGTLSYDDLMTRVRSKVMSRAADQHPQLEMYRGTEAREQLTARTDMPFLGGTITAKQDYFTVQHRDGQWVLNAGQVHGIPKVKGGAPTMLAIYDEHAADEDLKHIDRAAGEATVTKSNPEDSFLDLHLANGQGPAPYQVFKAKVKSIGRPPIPFLLEGELEGLEKLEERAAALKSVYVKLVSTPEEAKEAEYRIVADNDRYAIKKVGDDRPLVKEVRGYNDFGADTALSYLDTIAKWEQTLALDNPDTSFPDDAVKLELFDVLESQGDNPTKIAEKPLEAANGITLNYTYKDGEWHVPEFVIKVKNNTPKELYCAVLYMSSTFGVDDSFFQTQPMPGNAEGWFDQKKVVMVGVDDRLAQMGVLEETFVMKLVYSTNEFNSKQYNQEPLPLPVDEESTHGTRGLMRKKVDEVDWSTYELSVTVVRPPESVTMHAGQEVHMPGINIKPGSGLNNVKVGLISTSQATRDVGASQVVVPDLFDVVDGCEQMKFTQGAGADPGLSVLELTDVTDQNAVTPQNPLAVQLNAPLADDEFVIPFASDGEFFLPVGHTVRLANNDYEVAIEQLTEPTPAGTRSLGGSVKILFQKFVYQKIGLKFEYPKLAVATVEGEKVKYDSAVIQAVQKPHVQNILILMHGIIGDTEGMVKSVYRHGVEINGIVTSISTRFDVVLAFDYENLNTTIEENAQLLGQRLTQAGLAPGHGKNVTIMAHSMGGLVSRYYIEQLGGRDVISHLLMVGTPNAGSPIANVKEWATFGISALLGKISLAAWGLAPLTVMFNRTMNEAGVSLAQLKADSAFLGQLNDSNVNPGIPYTVVVGDCTVPPETLNRLADKMKLATTSALRWLFHGEHDIAVSKTSMKYVPNPNTTFLEIPCDHLTYFDNPTSTATLAQILCGETQAAAAPVAEGSVDATAGTM